MATKEQSTVKLDWALIIVTPPGNQNEVFFVNCRRKRARMDARMGEKGCVNFDESNRRMIGHERLRL